MTRPVTAFSVQRVSIFIARLPSPQALCDISIGENL
jgi:hypothetical protein